MVGIYLVEAALYLCFSLLVGLLFIHLVPNYRRPELKMNKHTLEFSIIGIMLFSSVHVVSLILFLYEDHGLWKSLYTVLGEMSVGKVWTITIIISILFLLFAKKIPILENKIYINISLFLTLLLIITNVATSHSTSIKGMSGLIVQTLHFLAVTVWAGILGVVSWFSIKREEWLNFLMWFTPIALTCFFIVIGSGFYIMSITIEITSYQDNWSVPYGMIILLKHLLVIPLIGFAIINGIWIKRKLKNGSKLNPIPWAKAESILILCIFVVTGALSQKEPPHVTRSQFGRETSYEFFESITVILSSLSNPELGLLFQTCLFLIITVFILYCSKLKFAAFGSLLICLFFVLVSFLGLVKII